MTRSELVARIAAQNPHLYAKEVEGVVDAILGRIEAALVAGDRVELRGFGAFSVREREVRTGRNPRTGETVEVEARTVVHFKLSKAVQAQLNRVEASPQQQAERYQRAS